MELSLALLPPKMPVKYAQWAITQVLKAQPIVRLVVLELEGLLMELPRMRLAKAVVQENIVIRKLPRIVVLVIVDPSMI